MTNEMPKKKLYNDPNATFVDKSQSLYWAWVTNPTPAVTPPVTTTSTVNPASSIPPATVATKQNPVVDLSKPKQEVQPVFNQYDTSAITNLDTNWLQDFIDQTNIDVRRGTPLTPEREAQLYKAQRRLQELAVAKQATNPIEPQISAVQAQKDAAAKRLETQSLDLIAKRKADLDAQYGMRTADLEKQASKTSQIVQSGLSFSWFGRSTYATEKQAEIQDSVNRSKDAMNAERDYALAKYQAELAGADAETLAQYDAQIAELQQQNTQFLIQSAQAMNEYNLQNSATYEEKVNNILQLAEANNVADLSEQEKAQASAYADLLLDAEWNLNTALIKDIPPRLVNEAIMQWAIKKKAIKPKMEAPETIKAEDGSFYAFNETTWEFEQIIGGKPMQSDKTVTIKNPDWSETIMQYNTQTGKYDIPVQPWWFTPNGTPINTAIQTAIQKNKTWAQCGKFVNDILQSMWLPRLIKDSYQSKEMAISQIGIATSYDDMWAWSIFAYPVKWSQNGHIGIITAVNDDWTIDIMDYNYKWDQQRRERQNVNPTEIINMWWRISKPIIRNDTVEQTNQTDQSNLQSPVQPSWKNRLPAGEASHIGEIKAAKTQADNLSSIIDMYKDVMWPISWRLWSINLWKWNAEQQKANAEFSRVTQIIGKSLEWGKLAEWDINRYLKMLPAVTDIPEVARSKINSAQAYLDTILEQKIKALWDAWYNVKDLYSNTDNQQTQQTTTPTVTPKQSKAYDDLRNSL